MKKNNIKIYIKLFLDSLGLLKLFKKIKSLFWKNSNQNSDFVANGFKVFELIVKNTNENNIEVWPTFGSLLGLVRDEKLLDYDNDLDFGCFFNFEIQTALREKLLGLGFRRVFSGYINDNCVLDKFIFDGVETDFYYFFKENDDVFSYDFEQDGIISVEENIAIGNKIIPYKNVYSKFNLKQVDLNNISFMIPDPIKTHLVGLYGKNYIIPDKNWHNNKRKNRYAILDAIVSFKNL